MSIDSKRHEVSQNSFRNSIRPWLKNASPYCTPKGVQGPSLMDPAITFNHYVVVIRTCSTSERSSNKARADFAARAFCFELHLKLFPNAATAVRSFGQPHRHGQVPAVADNFDVHGVAHLVFVENAKEIVVILDLLALDAHDDV